jgi:hypothetical protein
VMTCLTTPRPFKSRRTAGRPHRVHHPLLFGRSRESQPIRPWVAFVADDQSGHRRFSPARDSTRLRMASMTCWQSTGIARFDSTCGACARLGAKPRSGAVGKASGSHFLGRIHSSHQRLVRSARSARRCTSPRPCPTSCVGLRKRRLVIAGRDRTWMRYVRHR